MKLLALITDSFREIYAKKVIIGIVIIEVIALLITGFALFSDDVQTMYREASTPLAIPGADTALTGNNTRFPIPNDTALLGSNAPPAFDSAAADTLVHRMESEFAFGDGDSDDGTLPAQRNILTEMVGGQMGAFSAVISLATLFIGIFITAGIVPSMMEKGTIDLLISKPVPRTTILFGRALGGFIALAINLSVFIAGIWTLYGLASSVWHVPFLIWGILIPLFTFLVLFSAIILLNVITESWVLPMSLAYIHLMILGNFLSSREELLFNFVTNSFLQSVITGLYYVLPQTADLISATPVAVLTGSVANTGPFIQGIIFAVVMLSLAVWKFQKKDF